jgi:peptidoglycan/LPS O-acetylase OafA/YrhL
MSQTSANLDILRAVAVLLVLVSHIINALASSEAQSMGGLGVMMFFIHTSLVLTMSLDRLSAGGGSVAASFYVRRFFRIYPLSILTVILLTVFRIPTYFEPSYSWLGWKAFFANLALVQNLAQVPSLTGPLWSLPFEVQMYLLLPLLFMMARHIRTWTGTLLLIGGGFLLWWIESHLARALHYPALFTYAPWFFMGVGAWTVSRRVQPRWPGAAWIPVLALFVVLNVLAPARLGYRAGWFGWATGIALSLVLPQFRDVAWPALRRPAHLTARYSYGIYLSHVPILWVCFVSLRAQPFLPRALLCAVLLGLVPVILYHLVEAPMIAVGGSLAESFRRRALAEVVIPQPAAVRG